MPKHSFLLSWMIAVLPVGSSSLQQQHIPSLVNCMANPPIRQHEVVLQAQTGKSNVGLDDMISKVGLRPVKKKSQKAPSEKRSKKGAKSKSRSLRYSVAQNPSLRSQLDYARNGHAVLRNLFNPTTIKAVRMEVIDHVKAEELKAWRQKVEVALDSSDVAAACKTVEECQHQLENLGIEELPFLQYFNSWKSLPEVKSLAYALGESASMLLDVPTVRLYQDSIFWKRSVDGPTPWHVDARMAPFDTSHFITFWIPLNDIPSSGTALMFCSKSHSDFALPYWSPLLHDDHKDQPSTSEWNRLEHRYPEKDVHYMPMQVGDVTVHSGWTLHCANENDNRNDRIALAVSFVDAKAEIRPDAMSAADKGDNEDLSSYRMWVKDVRPRTQFQHDLVPIVWPRNVK